MRSGDRRKHFTFIDIMENREVRLTEQFAFYKTMFYVFKSIRLLGQKPNDMYI